MFRSFACLLALATLAFSALPASAADHGDVIAQMGTTLAMTAATYSGTQDTLVLSGDLTHIHGYFADAGYNVTKDDATASNSSVVGLADYSVKWVVTHVYSGTNDITSGLSSGFLGGSYDDDYWFLSDLASNAYDTYTIYHSVNGYRPDFSTLVSSYGATHIVYHYVCTPHLFNPLSTVSHAVWVDPVGGEFFGHFDNYYSGHAYDFRDAGTVVSNDLDFYP